MTTHSSPRSATIISFPPRGRFAAAEPREESRLAADFRSPRAVGDVFGSGWYHDAAIQDSKRTGEH